MGGGVMRTAAKLAGSAGAAVVSAAGIRGVAVPAEHHQVFSCASRKSYSPIYSAVEGSSVSVGEYATQRPSWESEEWEFAGVDEELSFEAESGALLMPRVVFGGAPTKEEAEEATLELKEALEKVLYNGSSDSAGLDGKLVRSNSGRSDSSVNGGIAARSAPQPALQAFKFLSSSPEAQNVVVSVVSDQNVWGAIFKNEAFVEYLESQRGSTVTSNESDTDQSIVDRNQLKGDLNCSDASSESRTKSGSFFTGFVDNVKISVVDLANNVSDFFQNIFGGGDAEKKSADVGDPAVVDMTTVGSYIMGLAIMVITIVVLKRV